MFRFYTLCTLFLAPVAAFGDAAGDFKDKVLPVLSTHCTRCHSGEKPKAKLDLAGVKTLDQLRADSHHWFRVLERVEAGSMPPENAKPLTQAEKQVLATWIRGGLTEALVEQQRKDGRSKLRRLSRNEYANTIYDLFGIRPAIVRHLPSDGRVDGYDKVSAALPFSSASTAGAMKITESLLSGILVNQKKEDRTYRLWAGPSEQSKGHILELDDGWMVSFNTDTTSGPLRRKSPDGKYQSAGGARVPGIHKLKIHAYAYQTDKPLAFGIYAGHTGAYPQLIDLVQVLEAPPGKPAVIETSIYLRTRLDNDIAPISDSFRLIPFGIGVQVPKNTQASNCKGPGLALQWVDVEEPESPLPGEKLLCADIPEKILSKLPMPGNAGTLKGLLKGSRDEFLESMRKTFERIGPRFLRRDLTEAELTRIVDSVQKQIDEGASFKSAFLQEVELLLTSPDFLCVIEQPGPLTNFALASRLAYFLWSSTPDAELLDVARKGQLTDAKILHQQTERLLNDPRSQRFVKDFTDQWLGLWGIENTTPDKDLYPEYDDLLKISSVMETQATFRKILDHNLSVRDFVAPDWALVNRRLAKVYGFPAVMSNEMQEVKLPADTPFGGIWTQAATMKVTANGTLTSPVKRGVWVAERLLGIPIPPPPPNIEPVDPDTRGAKTLREQIALHASQGSCKACHARFDPYGFALESFDVMGNFRTKYRIADPDYAKLPPNQRQGRTKWQDGLPVDSAGVTPEGKAFADVRELRQMLAKNPEQLARGVTRHLITFATGEPATPVDQGAIDTIVRSAATGEYGLRSLVHGVVQSGLFRSK